MAGITTYDNGRVVGLDLGSDRLSEGIPAELGDLAYLEELDLGINQLRGDTGGVGESQARASGSLG